VQRPGPYQEEGDQKRGDVGEGVNKECCTHAKVDTLYSRKRRKTLL
jgi:hypothetical protein